MQDTGGVSNRSTRFATYFAIVRENHHVDATTPEGQALVQVSRYVVVSLQAPFILELHRLACSSLSPSDSRPLIMWTLPFLKDWPRFAFHSPAEATLAPQHFTLLS
jgi:hypothetical protein